MNLEVIDSLKRLEEIKPDWKRLEKKIPESNPYFSYDFVWHWLKSSPTYATIYILAAWEGSLLALAPLYVQTRKKMALSWRELSFIGNGDAHNFLLDPDFPSPSALIKLFIQHLTHDQENFDRINLDKIPGNSDLSFYFFRDQKFQAFHTFYSQVPLLDLEALRKSQLPLPKPSKLNKYRNHLKKDHAYRFEVVKNPSRNELEKIFTFHTVQQDTINAGNKEAHRRRLFEMEGLRDFYRNFLPNHPDLILFKLLSQESRLIIYRMAYQVDQKIYSWNTAYNLEFANYRPNNILLDEIFQYALAEDIKIYDFGAGPYPWKFRLANDFLSLYNFDYWPRESLANTILQKAHRFKRAFHA